MPRDIVVVGASLGGVSALRALAASLPAGLPAAVLVVQHTSAEVRSALPEILSRAGPLPASHARDGEPPVRGRIYVAPPDRHLLLGAETMRLSHGPRENRHRPAVDALFRSAAESHGDRVIGVVLTGALGDGAAGLERIVAHGGLAVVQDPDDSESASMPLRALETVRVDHVAPLREIGPLLARLAGNGTTSGARPAVVDEQPAVRGLTCPDCGGTLTEVSPEAPHFRCHVGHAYEGASLLEARSERVEEALWSAVRQMEERRVVLGRLAEQSEQRGNRVAAQRYRARGEETARQAAVLRDVLGMPDRAAAE